MRQTSVVVDAKLQQDIHCMYQVCAAHSKKTPSLFERILFFISNSDRHIQ